MFEQQARNAGSARAHAVRFASTGPLSALIAALLGFLLIILALALLIPLLIIGVFVGFCVVLYLKLRSILSRVGSPNSHVGPVRTDGRDNVRVIDRSKNQ